MTDEEEKAEPGANPKGDFTCNTPDKSTPKAGFTCKSTKAEATRKAIKEGMIRQSLGNPLDKPASDLDVEVALELARQGDEEDVSFPSRPPRLKRSLDHSSHSASGRDAFLFNERAHDAAYAVPLCPKCENEHEIGEPCF